MITTLFTSYLFELLGRKYTIFISYILTAIVVYLIPLSAPNYTLLVGARCLLAVTMSAPMSHPLIADYVVKSSRGKAIALNGVGFVMGEILSMGVLFNLTKSLSFYDAFTVASILIFGFSLWFLISVKDIDMKKVG
jgi:MFS family permease